MAVLRMNAFAAANKDAGRAMRGESGNVTRPDHKKAMEIARKHGATSIDTKNFKSKPVVVRMGRPVRI